MKKLLLLWLLLLECVPLSSDMSTPDVGGDFLTSLTSLKKLSTMYEHQNKETPSLDHTDSSDLCPVSSIMLSPAALESMGLLALCHRQLANAHR
jgi:hypothetical protein